jgi:ABC-2 type transport system permease protein
MKQFYRLLTSHFKEIIREPSVLFWGIAFPILMAWGLGIAFTNKPEVTNTIVYIYQKDNVLKLPDYISSHIDLKQKSEDGSNFYQYSYSDKKNGKFKFNFYPKSWDQANSMLKKGETSIVIEAQNGIPMYYFDPLNPEAKLLYLQVSGLIEKGPAYFNEQTIHAQPLTLAGTRYVDFLIPGLLGMGIMMACMWGISYSVIEKRSKKLLRRMVATPMHKPLFLTSLFTARFVMNLAEAILLYIFAYFYFGITIQGSIWALILLFIAGNAAFSGLATLISCRTASPEVGNGLINAIVTPMMVVSGVFFSYHGFPHWVISIIKTLPLTMITDSFRAVFNEGAGIKDVIFPFFILLLEGTLFFVVGLKFYKWY